MAVTKTLQDCYDIAYWIIAQGQDSTAYPLTLMKSFINKAQRDISYWNVQNLSTNERLEKQSLTFLESNQFYTTHQYRTLSANAVVWATTLTCTNTFLSSGYLWINWNIISYSWNNWTTITWIPATWLYAIKFAFLSWTQVFQLDVLPTDLWQLSRAFLIINNTRVRQTLIWIDDRDLTNPISSSYLYNFFTDWYNWNWQGREWYYSIIRWQFILFITPQVDWNPISLEYQVKPTELVDPTDVLTIPDEYSLTTIPYMAVAEMIINRWEMDEWMKLNNIWFNNIKSMYQFYNTQRNELIYNQRVRTVSDTFYNF